MYAHYRMEADQTDSFAVVATKEEWLDVLTDIDAFEGEMSDNDFRYKSLEKGTEALVEALRAKGVRL